MVKFPAILHSGLEKSEPICFRHNFDKTRQSFMKFGR